MSNQPSTVPGQLAPFSQEAEEAVLGAVMVNPDAFLGVASFLNAEDFYILRHSYIWEALLRISERNEQHRLCDRAGRTARHEPPERCRRSARICSI